MKHAPRKMRPETGRRGERPMSKRDVVVAAVLALILAGGVAAAQVQVDSALPAYKAVSGVSGNLSSVGSDTLNGRNSASGTYGFFKEHTLKNGDFKDSVKEQPGSAAVVQGVTVDRGGIGYSGIGYATAGVRPVALAEKEGGKCVDATAENAYS